ncbi:MAG: hypothetical protein ACE366_16660 [Bradymonadia bacterium]
MSNKKATKAEVKERLEFCERLMLQGQRDRAVARAAVSQYGVSLRQALRYVEKIRKQWAQDAVADGLEGRKERLAKNRGRLEYLWNALMEKVDQGDVRAIRAAESIAVRKLQLDGVLTNNPPMAVNVAVSVHNQDQLRAARQMAKEKFEAEKAQA